MIDVTAGALTAGSLALDGGRIVGDVTVSDALVYASAAFQNGTFAKLTINGKLTFAEGATVDLDAFVATGERAAGAADGRPSSRRPEASWDVRVSYGTRRCGQK